MRNIAPLLLAFFATALVTACGSSSDQLDLDHQVTGKMLLGESKEKIIAEMEGWTNMEKGGMEMTTDKESMLCYKTPVLQTKQCYEFVDGACRAITSMSLKETREDAMEDVAKQMEKWGEPVAYAADHRRVNSLDRAVALADQFVSVAFAPTDEGVALLWMWKTTPGEEGLTGGRHTYLQKYIDLSYIDDLSWKNYWD